MKILFPNSNWASNIGNPFFTLGIAHALKLAKPEVEVIFTASNPILPLKLGPATAKYSFDYSGVGGAVDAYLFTGPMFDLNFRRFYEQAFRSARETGAKIILLSAGSIDYSAEEVAHCRAVLSEFKPHILVTRDHQTFERYGDLASHSYDGVCGAWFAPDYYPGYDTPRLANYITTSFDFRPELGTKELELAIAGSADVPAAEPKMGKTAGRITRVLDRGGPSSVGSHEIIRVCHRPANAPLTIFNKPNTFASFTPYGYLNLYRNTTVTVTDRLHAAVVTLAYGNPAYLYLRSKRSFLLGSMGVDYQPGKRMTLDRTVLASKKAALVDFLAGALAA